MNTYSFSPLPLQYRQLSVSISVFKLPASTVPLIDIPPQKNRHRPPAIAPAKPTQASQSQHTYALATLLNKRRSKLNHSSVPPSACEQTLQLPKCLSVLSPSPLVSLTISPPSLPPSLHPPISNISVLCNTRSALVQSSHLPRMHWNV